jgi:RNA polymerase sigma-H factor
MIGLFKAIRDFEAEKRARFCSFAELCITRQIISAVKSATRFKHGMLSDCVSLDVQSLGGDEGGCLLDAVADAGVADPESVLMQRQMVRFARTDVARELSALERCFAGIYGGQELSAGGLCAQKIAEDCGQCAAAGQEESRARSDGAELSRRSSIGRAEVL